jgi:ATP-binding cassette subfamily B (MDR/TAP) protein 6
VEQGSHKELLSFNGIFAKMWADQISADKRAQSIGSPGKESVLGYLIDDVTEFAAEPLELPLEDAVEATPKQVIEDADKATDTELIANPSEIMQEPTEPEQSAAPTADQEQSGEGEPQRAQGSYAQVAAAAPTGSSVVKERTQTEAAPVPIAFPGKGDETSSQHGSSIAPATSGNVTFSPGVDSPPSRPDTPEGDSKPKRKRLSSQNFQRLARRISLGGKRTDSATSISSQTAVDASPSGSRDGGLNEAGGGGGDTATPETKKGKTKKDKKSKKGTK